MADTTPPSRETTRYGRMMSQLSNVPVFILTDQSGDSPYFTSTSKGEKDANGKPLPLGFYFLEKRDADALLSEVQRTGLIDSKVSTIPLDEALKLQGAPDLGGKFEFAPSRVEMINANVMASSAGEGTVKAPLVPLFYDERLSFSGESRSGSGGDTAFPLYFKKSDLDATWDKAFAKSQKQDTDEGVSGAVRAAPKVTTLQRVVEQMRSGDKGAEELRLVTTERFISGVQPPGGFGG